MRQARAGGLSAQCLPEVRANVGSVWASLLRPSLSGEHRSCCWRMPVPLLSEWVSACVCLMCTSFVCQHMSGCEVHSQRLCGLAPVLGSRYYWQTLSRERGPWAGTRVM